MLFFALLSCTPGLSLSLPTADYGIQRDARNYLLVKDADPCPALARLSEPTDWELLLVEVTPDAISSVSRDGLRELQSLRDGQISDARGALIPTLFDEAQRWSRALSEQPVQCGTSPQEEVLIAVDPRASLAVLQSVRFTLGQAGFSRQALWIDSASPLPGGPHAADDVAVQVAMLGTELEVSHPTKGTTRGSGAGALAAEVLGEAPDCAMVLPAAGTFTADFFAVLDSLTGAGARSFLSPPWLQLDRFPVETPSPRSARPWSLDATLAVLPLELSYIPAPDHKRVGECDPADTVVPERSDLIEPVPATQP
jgi:hypothetical protein